MIELLNENSLLLLFLVTALGFTIGRIPILGIRFGSAAVLFVGLFFGSLDPNLSVPQFVPQLGLVIFLYALGLANGANFFRAIRQQGNQQITFVLMFLTLPIIVVTAAFFLLGISPAELAGLYAGSATNTAALAGVLDVIGSTLPTDQATTALAATVVGYSLGYPVGVIGRIVVITLMQRVWRIDFAAEAHDLRDTYPLAQEIVNRAIRITQPNVTGRPLRELQREFGWDVIFGRFVRDGTMTLITGESQFELGDVVVIAGELDSAENVIAHLGENAGDKLLTDYSVYAKQRLFVSNLDVIGETIASLDLKEQYGALLTRVRRGDSDVLATRDTRLEWGDRVRVLARRSEMPRLIDLFGDSYESVSQVNLLSFGFGVTFGLLLGMVQIMLPGVIGFQLGFAGGVLIVALILGELQRTGSIVWTLPYSANQTMQQIGLVLLLAGIGVRSGNAFESSIAIDKVLLLLTIALVAVCVSTWFALLIGYKRLKIPFTIVAGMVASQPAVLSYIVERAKNPLPNIGFAFAMPIGIIVKVAYAQLLFVLLSRL